jgi:hypothetical protein
VILQKRFAVPAASKTVSAVLGVLLAAFIVADGHGQVSECAGVAGPPGDAALRVTLENGQSVFQQGEIIALKVEYSAAVSNKYVVNNRTYDRSGRLSGTEIFCLDPERGIDPLDDYFHSLTGFIGGGLSSEQDPAREPLSMTLELNEWKSLPPGSYRLSIVGNRLSLGKERDSASWGHTIIPLRSGTIAFDVVPADSDWQAAQLASATSVLDSPDANEGEKNHAARVLRFLGSAASTRELARRFGSGNESFDWDFKFGLYSTPLREVAIQSMKAELSDPGHPVTRDYVSTLVALEMLTDPRWRLPAYDPTHQEEWHRAYVARDAEAQRRIDEYMAQVVKMPRDAAAQATTASEILQSGLLLGFEAKARWRQALLSNWEALPVERQNELIENHWPAIGGPEWLSTLEQIVAGPPNPEHAANRPNREYALLRLWQLAPEEAQPLMLQEIAKPHGDIGIRVLQRLPDPTLPQFEKGWLRLTRQDGVADVVYQLIDRYASERILPELQTVYEAHRGEWACIPQTAMLRYFLRTKPDYGLKELSAAMMLRKATGCYQSQLGELGDYARMPQVQKLAVQVLDDPVPSVASDAARTLQLYGSASAEDALLARLDKLHEQWKGKAAQLPLRVPDMTELDSESGLEASLVQGILQGQDWFADRSTIRHLGDLTGSAVQAEADTDLKMLESSEFLLAMNWFDDELDYTLGWYSGKGMKSFKEKLAQFPPGSHFKMVTTKAEVEAHQSEFAEAEEAASENGSIIEVSAPR